MKLKTATALVLDRIQTGVGMQKTDSIQQSIDLGASTSPHAEEGFKPPAYHLGDGGKDEGDLLAWGAVAAAWLLFLISWGQSLSFGVFEAFYKSNFLIDYSASNIAWIGSVESLFLVSTGAFVGPLFDRGFLFPIMATGCFLLTFGLMMLSLANQYYQIFLAQGVCMGIGAGTMYVPAIAMVANMFDKKRALAMSTAISGVSFGGIIVPITFRRLLPQIGFPWAVRVLGFMSLALSVASLSILWHIPPKTTRPRRLFEVAAFREVPFVSFCMAGFSTFLAYWIPIFYIPSFTTGKLHAGEDLSFYMIAILNAGSVLGRFAPSFIIPLTGAATCVCIGSIASAILLFSWVAVENVGSFIAWAILFGITSGVLIGAYPIAISHPTISTMTVYGTRAGIINIIAACGALIGTPIAGALANPDTGSFINAQVFAGALMMAGGMFYVYPAIKQQRYDRSKR